MFHIGNIEGVIVRDLTRHADKRGWLTELFRQDEIPSEIMPVMAYLSVTQSGIARGPHEHVDQTDVFAFVGPSTFRVYLWDNRKTSETFQAKQIVEAGVESPRLVVIPPGVVHAYRNVGADPGTVINLPNRLFAGPGKKSPVDEIRHEQDPHSVFVLD